MSKDPYGQLASSLLSSFHKQTRQAIGGVGAVLGTITSTGLKLDDFKHELQEYMVAELPGQLSLPRRTVEGTISGDGGKTAVSLELENGSGGGTVEAEPRITPRRSSAGGSRQRRP